MKLDIYILLLVILPAITVALVCYFSIQSMLKNELFKQKYALMKNSQKEMLPLKIQAFERLTLFLDRISLHKLLVRVSPTGEETTAYKNLLIATIDQELEHNITQQIYVSEECWKIINTAKNTVISQLHSLSTNKEVTNASTYRSVGLTTFSEINSSTHIAQAFIRSELKEFF